MKYYYKYYTILIYFKNIFFSVIWSIEEFLPLHLKEQIKDKQKDTLCVGKDIKINDHNTTLNAFVNKA